jgi:hypothetical protein
MAYWLPPQARADSIAVLDFYVDWNFHGRPITHFNRLEQQSSKAIAVSSSIY